MKVQRRRMHRGETLEVELIYDPLIIWLTLDTELIIERGDVLLDVVNEVQSHFPQLDDNDFVIAHLVAYWFALGERLRSGNLEPWTKKELRTNPKRRYLSRSK